MVFTVLLVVACSVTTPENSAPQSQRTPSDNCRLVKHEAGETTVCGQPQKVVALSPRVLEVMLALDIQPAAYAELTSLNLPKFDNPSEQIPYLGERITTQPINLGSRNNPSLETLTLLNPDLIIGETWHDYDLFSKIAPTLLLEPRGGEELWQQRLQVVAQAFGREERAEQVIARHNRQVAQARIKLTPVAEVYPRVLAIQVNQRFDHILVIPPLTEWLEAIGFQPLFLEESSRESVSLSLEVLSQLDPDLIIVGASPTGAIDNFYQPEETIKRQWEQTPVLRNMRAFREGRVYFANSRLLWQEGPIKDEIFLEMLPELLLPSLKGATDSQ